MAPSDAIMILILFILLLSSAFFSSAETALTTVNKLRIRSLVEEDIKSAKTVSLLIENPSKLLSAILIGNNIVNLSASSLATTLAIRNSDKISVGVATAALTIFIILFGEITPKTLATIHAEKLSLAYSMPIFILTKLLTPVIFIVNKLSNGILKIIRVDINAKGIAITENELRTIVDVSHEEGVIESEERQMITNVVDFGDSYAKDIMVPRIDMEFASIDLCYSELISAFGKEKYTRMPVYNGTRDNIVGVVHLKDVFFYPGSHAEFKIEKIIREPFFTYEYKKTSELFIEMRKNSIYLAIVLDEYGATAGLITLEDLIEEIVGEIRDEYDDDEEDSIQFISENEFIADGNTKLDDINEVLGLSLESNDYDSIAGHIINLLDHLPDKGECVAENNVTFTVTAVDKNRIDKIHILISPDDPKLEEANS